MMTCRAGGELNGARGGVDFVQGGCGSCAVGADVLRHFSFFGL